MKAFAKGFVVVLLLLHRHHHDLFLIFQRHEMDLEDELALWGKDLLCTQ